MSTLSFSLSAGLILAAIPWLKRHGLPAPTANAVLLATSSSRTTAYKVKGRIEEALPTLIPAVGRPKKAPVIVDSETRQGLTMSVLRFVFDHPGCVSGTAVRRTYTAAFRLHVLELCEDVRLPYEAVSDAANVPGSTLKGWMRGELPQVKATNLVEAAEPGVTRIEMVVAAYKHWESGFKPFCKHIQFNLRIPFSRATIDDILKAHGLRSPTSRRRAPDASINRGGFETFYPNAQWVADGTELDVHVAGQNFKVNLEFMLDAHTGAIVGASIRPTEDATAVTEAFADGVATAGEPPVALLLDNKPSNHGQQVVEALDDTLLMRSRPYVPTDKPVAEGAFGLFQQQTPPIVIHSTDPAQIAAEVAALLVSTWARAINHRPRADREGQSRVELFQNAKPTDEEIEAAKESLRARQRKQELARQTRQRRQDPITRSALDQAFERLDLEDPDGNLRLRIASWPLNHVLEGIATFEGKKKAGTLPEGVDGRYLRGIVKNIAEENEGMEIMQALLRMRLQARDEMLEHLGRQQDRLSDAADDTDELVKKYVTKAMEAERGVDRTFWLLATVDVIREEGEQRRLLRLAGRRIHATYSVRHQERLAAVRFLFAKVVPVD